MQFSNTKPRLRFHVMAKPIGPLCNLGCSYCFYLHKKDLLATQDNWLMPEQVLEKFIRHYIQEQDHDEIIFSWQGGEPTLCGLDYFEKIVVLERKYMGDKVYSKRFADQWHSAG